MASPESQSKLSFFKFVSNRKHSGTSLHNDLNPLPVDSHNTHNTNNKNANSIANKSSNTTTTTTTTTTTNSRSSTNITSPKSSKSPASPLSSPLHKQRSPLPLPTTTSNIDKIEDDDFYRVEAFYNQDNSLLASPMLQSSSETPMIFERNVEDPIPLLTNCPRCGSRSINGQLKCSHQSIVNLPSHYSMENFVSPCLDATAEILTDKTTDLDSVDMVYSRRPSTINGIEAALGRTKSYSSACGPSSISINQGYSSPNSPQTLRTHSFANMKDLEYSTSRPPILSFYSYADVICNEPNPRRPSISQSLSSSFLPFLRSSSSPLTTTTTTTTTHTNSSVLQRSNSMSPTSCGTAITTNTSVPNIQSPNFTTTTTAAALSNGANVNHNDSSSPPNSSDSENEYNPVQLTLSDSISSRLSTCSKKSNHSSNSRRLTFLPRLNTNPHSPSNLHNSNKSLKPQSSNSVHHPPHTSDDHIQSNNNSSSSSSSSNQRPQPSRTVSKQSSFASIHTAGTSGSRGSRVSRRYSNFDELNQESFVISSIGDEIRKNTGEIKSN